MADVDISGTEHLGGAKAKEDRRHLTGSDWTLLGAAIATPGILAAVPGIGNFLVLPLMDEFGASRAAVLLFIAIATIGPKGVLPIVGRVLITTPPWMVMLFGAVIAGAGLLAAGIAPTFGLVAAGFVTANIIGVACCGNLAGQMIAVERFPERLGIVAGGQIVALAVTSVAVPLIVAPVLTARGWRFSLASVGVFLLILLPTLIVSFLRVELRAPAGEPSATSARAAVGDAAIPPTTLQIVGSPAFWLLLLAMVPVFVLSSALGPNLIPFYDDRGVDLQHASYVLATIGLASAVGALLGGFIVDRVAPALVASVIAGVAFAGMCALSLNLGAPAILLAVMFVGLGGLAPTLGVAVRRYFGAAGYAPTVGLLGPFMIPSAFSAPVAGWMRDQFGSYQLVFGILAALMLVSLIASLLLLAVKPKPGSLG